MSIVLFIVGLILVIIGSDVFVEAAVRAARRLKMSEMLIGITLVSLGTTLPELTVSTTAAIAGHADMAASNAIGSIICNTALIAGLIQAIKPTPIEPMEFRKNGLCFFSAAAVFCLLAYSGGGVSRISGCILLLCMAIYIAFFTLQSGSDSESNINDYDCFWGDLILMGITSFALFYGARLLVTHGSLIAEMIGIPERVVSVSMIAFGTSLPELMTAITALRKKHSALSLGNIIGANILNLLLVLGASGAIAPFTIPADIMRIDIPIMLLVSGVLLLPGLIRKRLSRIQGAVMLLIYFFYIFYLYLFR